jgi:peptidoglycan/LPS O-acetylase OafA/YrhL
MNLDDLMDVWRSQDAAPLHGINETLLRLALRQDEAKLQQERRRERWTMYVFSAVIIAAMAVFIALLAYHYDGRRVSVWDFAAPVAGAAAAVLSGRAIHANHRAQTAREQNFGESLRDQINRRIAQVDDQATTARRTSVVVTVLMGGVCPAAILIAAWRINQKSISDDGYMLVSLILICVWSVATSVRELRRQVQRTLLPRKVRLEALLRELEGH